MIKYRVAAYLPEKALYFDEVKENWRFSREKGLASSWDDLGGASAACEKARAAFPAWADCICIDSFLKWF